MVTWHEIRRLFRDETRKAQKLKSILSLPLQRSLLMVSVVSYGGIPDLLRKQGFTKTRSIDLGALEAEITGGYASILRGDPRARFDRASVFPPQNYAFDRSTQLICGPISFGLSDKLAHWIGPSEDLANYLPKFCVSAVMLGSVTGDLIVALQFWRDSSKVHNLIVEGEID